MKHSRMVLGIIGGALFANVSFAGFSVPNNIFRMDQFSEAQALANEKNIPLTFIYSDKTGANELASIWSVLLMEELNSCSVVVYVDTKNRDFAKLEKGVKRALKSDRVGEYTPQTVVMDQQLESVITYIPYTYSHQQKKVLKEAKKSIKKLNAPKREVSRVPIVPSVLKQVSEKNNREMRTWHSLSGAEVEASLLKTSGAYAMLNKKGGGMIRILINSLSSADQKYIEQLK